MRQRLMRRPEPQRWRRPGSFKSIRCWTHATTRSLELGRGRTAPGAGASRPRTGGNIGLRRPHLRAPYGAKISTKSRDPKRTATTRPVGTEFGVRNEVSRLRYPLRLRPDRAVRVRSVLLARVRKASCAGCGRASTGERRDESSGSWRGPSCLRACHRASATSTAPIAATTRTNTRTPMIAM